MEVQVDKESELTFAWEVSTEDKMIGAVSTNSQIEPSMATEDMSDLQIKSEPYDSNLIPSDTNCSHLFDSNIPVINGNEMNSAVYVVCPKVEESCSQSSFCPPEVSTEPVIHTDQVKHEFDDVFQSDSLKVNSNRSGSDSGWDEQTSLPFSSEGSQQSNFTFQNVDDKQIVQVSFIKPFGFDEDNKPFNNVMEKYEAFDNTVNCDNVSEDINVENVPDIEVNGEDKLFNNIQGNREASNDTMNCDNMSDKEDIDVENVPDIEICLMPEEVEQRVLPPTADKQCTTVRYKCVACARMFVLIDSIRKHVLKLHTEGEKYITITCKLCTKTFSDAPSMDGHLLTTHSFIFCTLCKKNFKFQANHMSVRHELSTWCEACNRDFSTILEKDQHSREVHGCKPLVTYFCATCSVSFLTQVELKNHMTDTHSSTAYSQCKLCTEKPENRVEHFLEAHVVEVVFPVKQADSRVKRRSVMCVKRQCNKCVNHQCVMCIKRRCVMCGKSYKTTRALQKHENSGCSKYTVVENNVMKNKPDISKEAVQEDIIDEDSVSPKSDTESSAFTCEYCHKMFMSEHYLDRHICDVRKNPNDIHCAPCNRTFNSSVNLMLHTISDHIEKLTSRRCDHCGNDVIFRDAYELVGHMTQQHSVLECFCGVLFPHSNLEDLMQHMAKKHRTKTDECSTLYLGPYLCTICKDFFPTEENFKHHAIKHSHKTFKCPQCDKTFRMQHLMKKHFLVNKCRLPGEIKLPTKLCRQNNSTKLQSSKGSVQKILLSLETVPERPVRKNQIEQITCNSKLIRKRRKIAVYSISSLLELKLPNNVKSLDLFPLSFNQMSQKHLNLYPKVKLIKLKLKPLKI